LKEFQDIFKRCEADKLQEAASRAAAAEKEHQLQMAAMQHRLAGLQEELQHLTQRCSSKEADLDCMQKQAGMLAVQMREAQRFLAAAQEGRAAAERNAEDIAAEVQVHLWECGVVAVCAVRLNIQL